MDCAAAKPKMEALASGTLPEPERALVDQHIAMCEGCRLELELVRAIGSQEKPPEVGEADWTLDRIFGAESAENPATPAEEAAPDLGVLDQVSVGRQAAEEAASTAPEKQEERSEDPASWSFEPADAKPDLVPPAKSLFFAEETLTRRRGVHRKKSSTLRLVLWTSGGVVGAVLLALSTWVALHMTQPSGDRDDASAPQRRVSARRPSAAQPQETPAQAVADSNRAPASPAQAAADSNRAPAPAEGPDAASAGSGTATNEPAAPSPAPSRDGQLSASSSAQPSPLPALAPRTARPKSPETAAAPSAKPSPTRSALTTARPATPAEVSPAPRAEPAKPSTPAASEPQASTAAHAPVQTSAPQTGDEAFSDSGPAPVPTVSSTEPLPAPRPSALPLSTGSHAAAKPAPQSATASPAPEVTTPIDRLHLATGAAEQRGDIIGLRHLRTTWKDFMAKMGVGPDRARAKREYAECLWAIQSLTGKRADQKDALAAYREYILSAPAGGADTRSVSRLRQLEDALSEQH